MSADSSAEDQPLLRRRARGARPSDPASGFKSARSAKPQSPPVAAGNEEPPQPKPVMPVKVAQPKKEQKHYPPPNIRDQLSPELEAEYLAAVGEMSFDDLMESATVGAPPTEIAPETRVTGRVAKIHRDDVFIDLPGRSQGVVPLRQFETPPVEGAELELVVAQVQRRRRALRTVAAAPPRSRSAIGKKSAKGRSSRSRSPAATRAAWNARSPASAASFRWGRSRCTASKTRKSTSASGWRAS